MLQLIGLIVVILYGLQILKWLYGTFLRRVDYGKYNTPGSCVLVTGATDGIGLGFARAFARRGFNLVLVSRNRDKLEEVRCQLQPLNPKAKHEIVVSEAQADATPDQMAKLRARLDRFDVCIVVNNVGIGLANPGKLEYLQPAELLQLVDVNCCYPMLLTQALIEKLRERSTLRKLPTAVINVASVAAFLPTPSSAVYAATKAFNWAFSKALSIEYAPQGIDVLTVSPGYVASKLTGMRKGLLVCDADECAEFALRRMGQEDIVPHWKHALLYAVAKPCMDSLPARLLARIFSISTVLKFRPKYQTSKLQ
jgi:17beta-estradiol 17-dehydrogenase / very-long-chain 3-oxoacyl-CoA reductase